MFSFVIILAFVVFVVYNRDVLNMNMTDYFFYLKGSWDFQRSISNGSKVIGKALFQIRGENTLHYREEGILTTPEGNSLTCYQEYVYRLEDGAIHLFFNENPLRFFYTVRLTDPFLRRACGEHLCLSDLYRATYFFESERNFTLQYVVNGPSKNYQIITKFSKVEFLMD